MRLLFSTFTLAIAISITAFAQIGFPGQTGPYPSGGGGGRNGGQYPGGPNGPNGGGRGGGVNGPGLPSKSRNRKSDPVPTVSTTGILRLVGKGSLSDRFVLEADDHRVITYSLGERSKVLKEGKPVELSSFEKGDHLTVDATSDDEGNFTAVEVSFFSLGTPADRAVASRTWDLPDLKASGKADKSESKEVRGKKASASRSDDDDQRPVMRRPNDPASAKDNNSAKDTGKDSKNAEANSATKDDEADDSRPKTQVVPDEVAADPDDPGRPQIKRGQPVPRAAPAPTTTAANRNGSARPESSPLGGIPNEVVPAKTTAESAGNIIPVEEDPIIVKAKAAAAEYTGTLPNYLVKQNTTRYDSENPKNGWDAHDIVTADVTYKDGTQEYSNVKVGSRSVKSISDTGGNWSTGEFASWIDDVFSPNTAARFRRSGQETVNGRPCIAFKYEVTRERSHWRVMAGSAQLYYPAYRGTVWIDRESSRVMRLEVESRGMPLLFPFEKVEMAMDYDFVRLAAPRPFLLPTVAEVLTCEQGNTRCSRNRIEFRNYHKFGAESDITFEDKQ